MIVRSTVRRCLSFSGVKTLQNATGMKAALPAAQTSRLGGRKIMADLTRTADYGPMSPVLIACLVSFTDTENIRHAVEVSATALYEAAVLAMMEFRAYSGACE